MPQSVRENFENLQSHLGIFKTSLSKTICRQPQQSGRAGRFRTGRIPTTVKDGHLRQRTPFALDAEELLSPAQCRLNYLYCSLFDDQKLAAHVALSKN